MENRIAFQPEFLQASWLPWFMALAIALGAGLGAAGIRGMRKHKSLGLVTVLLGAALGARGVTNRGLATLLGTFINPVVRLRRSINIHATVDEVYDFFRRFENYSHFMSYVHDVKVDDSGGLEWTIIGPAGVRIQWKAAMTALIPRQLVSWKSLPRSLITNAGAIRIRPIDTDLTLVDIELTFAPPAGALGYAVAKFLGFDPKDKIDEDLSVMRGLIEESSILRSA
jgi:uncharacterized membrane protein